MHFLIRHLISFHFDETRHAQSVDGLLKLESNDGETINAEILLYCALFFRFPLNVDRKCPVHVANDHRSISNLFSLLEAASRDYWETALKNLCSPRTKLIYLEGRMSFEPSVKLCLLIATPILFTTYSMYGRSSMNKELHSNL